MNLSEHFTLEEATYSETAVRQGIDNQPSTVQLENMKTAAQKLEQLRAVTGPLKINSWLSKNIRPMVLIFLLLAYSGFAIASIFNYETRGAYVELLGQWGMLVMSFYFGGRTMEKLADKVKK